MCLRHIALLTTGSFKSQCRTPLGATAAVRCAGGAAFPVSRGFAEDFGHGGMDRLPVPFSSHHKCSKKPGCVCNCLSAVNFFFFFNILASIITELPPYPSGTRNNPLMCLRPQGCLCLCCPGARAARLDDLCRSHPHGLSALLPGLSWTLGFPVSKNTPALPCFCITLRIEREDVDKGPSTVVGRKQGPAHGGCLPSFPQMSCASENNTAQSLEVWGGWYMRCERPW